MSTASHTPYRLLATVVLLALGLTACGLFEDEQADTASVALDEDEPGDAAPSETEMDAAPAPPAPADPPSDLAIDLQARDTGGVVVRLTGISFDDTAIRIAATITNGRSGAAVLNSNSRGGVALEDDLGNLYGFLPPEENARLEVEPGERLDGTLVFDGELREGVTSLTLTFNRNDVVFENIPVR